MGHGFVQAGDEGKGIGMKKETEKLQCIKATKMIPAFIADELSHRELEQFMEHIGECGSCKEELSIQFLVEVGLNSLEAGNTFDLQQELNMALEEAEKRVQVYRFFRQSGFVLACVGIAAGLIGMILLALYFLG